MGNKNKGRFTLWIVAALYLLYLSYSIIKGYLNGERGAEPWMLLVVVVFIVLSLGLLVFAFKEIKSIAEEEVQENEEESEEEEDAEEDVEPEPEPEPEESRPMTISERAKLPTRVKSVDGILEEVEDKE